MDISRALQFFTDDEQWVKKMAIGALWVLLSIFILPIFFLTGYSIQIARNVKDGMDTPLPEWNDLGAYFKDGAMIAIAGFIYALPMFVLLAIGVAIAATGGALESDALAATGGLVLALFGCVAAIYAIALALLAPSMYIQYIEHGTLASCLRWRKLIDITRNNIGDIVISVLVVMGIGLLVSFVSWIPCLGILIALAVTPYLQFVTAHLYGQIAAKALGKGSKFDDIVIS